MKQSVLLTVIISLFLLSGCATTSEMQQGQVERMTPEELEKLIPAAIATYTLEEIVKDSKQGQKPEAIIEKIKSSESRYELTAKKILELNAQGVDATVLDYIQESNELAKQNYIADEINKAEKEKDDAIKRLRHERMFRRHHYHNPFWYSRFGPYYGRPYIPRSRLRWGLGIGW